MGNWYVSKPDNDGERELLDRAVKALEAELATKTCNKQITSKLENAELARDSEETCNNKQVISKLVASEEEMTREEAIMVLKNEQPHCGKKALFPEEKKYEAYDVAIKALEQEPCEDAISRADAEALFRNARGELHKSAIRNEQNGHPIKDLHTRDLMLLNAEQMIHLLPSVTPKQEPCKDAVSRQVAIDAFSMFAEYESNRTNAEWVDRIRVVLSSLPPVQPISRWITVTDKLPSDCDEDWVLVQIQEDNGYLWIPRVMEYRKSKDDWWGEDIGWLKNSNGVFKVIAWMPLPKPYEPQESEERP